MSTPLALSLSTGQILILLSLAAIALLYVSYFRIWVAVAVASDLMFVAALAAAAASVVAPDVFSLMARDVVDRSPLPAALGEADARVAAIVAMPRELVEEALRRVGLEDYIEPFADEEIAEASDPAESDPTDAASLPADPRDETRPDDVGPFTRTIRPTVESLVALVIRGATFGASGLLLLLSLASRASTTTARRLRALSARLDALEAQGTTRAATQSAR